VTDNTASIVTNSWGEPTYVMIDGVVYPVIDQTIINAYESVFRQGAAQGIGFYFSSGDNGDELANWGVAAPDWPTEDPWVTSVGGTSLAIGQDNARIFETGWGTAKWNLTPDRTRWQLNVRFLYGAGGGFTVLNGSPYFGFDRPFYQVGVVPDYTQGRAVPDIAMDGDPTTGMLVGETQYFALKSRYGPAGVHYGEYRIGGTSLSSPLFAGVQAVAQSRNRSFGRIGFANPMIYLIDRSSPSSFFDVTPQGDIGNVRADFLNKINSDGGLIYSVRTFDQDSSLTVGPGWDDVTGVGSPTAEYLNLLSR
jgi:subtilase family serine protease